MNEFAEEHLKRGWSILPVPHRSKHPTMPWTEFQRRRPTEEEAVKWWGDDPYADAADIPGFAVVCGQVSDNLVCLDFDFRHLFIAWHCVNKGLYDLPVAKSNRGYHVFFRTEQPIPSGKFGLAMSQEKVLEVLEEKGIPPHQALIGSDPAIPHTAIPCCGPAPAIPQHRNTAIPYCGPAGDLISDGKLVVIPPTMHPSGDAREWCVPPKEQIPTVKLEDIGITYWPPQGPISNAQYPPPRPCPEGPFLEGNRHAALLSIAARLRNANVSPAVLHAALEETNKLECIPPLPEREIANIAKWAINLPDHPSSFGGTTNEEGLGVEKSLSLVPRPSTPNPQGETMPMIVREFGPGYDGKPRTGVWFYPAHKPQETEKLNNAFESCDAYLEHEQVGEEVDWLVDGFLPKGYLVVLGGTSKAGKTCFLTKMAMAVAQGQPFLGLNTEKSAVLWSCYQESRSERAYALRQYDSKPENFYITHEKPMIDSEEGLNMLRHWINKTGAKLLVIDPLYGANEATSLTDGRSARNTLQGLKDLCNETGCTIVVVHHFTKNVGAGLVRERLADSNQITATASMDILMDADEQSDGSRLIRMKCKGRGTFANQTWIIKSKAMTDFTLVGNGQGLTVDSIQKETLVVESLESIAEEALTEGREVPGLTTAEIAERTSIHPKTMNNLIAAMVGKGLVRESGKRGRWKLFVSATVSMPLPEAA